VSYCTSSQSRLFRGLLMRKISFSLLLPSIKMMTI
jgi:hypothetical protein